MDRSHDTFYFCIKALEDLAPGIQIHARSEDGHFDYSQVAVHSDHELPTEEAIWQRATELHDIFTGKQYQRDRQSEYPSLAEFADAYYWAQKGDNTKMEQYVAKCDEVRAKYPKANTA